MTKFATWGAAMESLDKAIAAAKQSVWDNTTPSDRPAMYFSRELYIVHHAFQKWCESTGYDPTELRKEIVNKFISGQMIGLMNPLRMEKLVLYVPVEFSVRGVWTPVESEN